MKLGTLCYIEQDGRYLMLHRTKKQNDIHEGLWIGVGGKLESGESPEECVIREVHEETGLTIERPALRGIMTFPGFQGDADWYVFLFTASAFSGELKPCDEGDLAWIPVEALDDVPMHAGDRHFLRWIRENEGIISAKYVYDGEVLTDCQVAVYGQEGAIMEGFDIYNADHTLTGRRKGYNDPIAEGEYFLIAHCWVKDAEGKFLIGRRAKHKSFGGLWECPGGGAVAGENSLNAAVREAREETGVQLDPASGRMIRTCVYDEIHAICDVWLFDYAGVLGDFTLALDEVTDVRTVAPGELMAMYRSGEFIPVYGYLEWLFEGERR